MSLSAARDCLTVADLDFWFNYIEEFQEVFDAGVHYECSSMTVLRQSRRFWKDKMPGNLKKKQTA